MQKIHKIRTRILGMFLALALLLSSMPTTVFAVADNGSEETIGIRNSDFLKADGKLVRKNYGTGEAIYLRGTNAGGYMLQEFWMCLTEYTDNVSCELELYEKLTERFGEKTAMELVDYYQDTYWTEQDFDNCAKLGMNCIRLPIWYRNLVDKDGKFLSDAWDRIDWFIEQAGKRGIYVIIDMHGAPGSQNGSDHSGVDGRENKKGASKFFWGNDAKANQNLFYTIWENIARRYKDNPIVAGYDLLNEPYCTYRYDRNDSEWVDELHNLLWGIYDKAYDKIRAIDKNHMIIMEATWDPWDLPNPSDYEWTNVMYEYHNYMYKDLNNDEGQQIASMKNKTDAIANMNYNVPSYMGEFNYMDNPDAWKQGLKLLNDNNLHWTIWTYKTVSSSNNWGTFHHSSDNKVNIEKDSADTIKSKWKNAATTAENTKLTAAIKEYFPGVNKTTQYVTLKDGDYYLTVNDKVVKAEDSGKSPLAAVSSSYSGNGEKLTVVNNEDGTFSLKSAANGKYVCAVIDEKNQLLARSEKIDAWEKFYAVRINDSQIGILSCANGRYVKADFNSGQGSVLKAESSSIAGAWEAFTIKGTNGEAVDLGGGSQNDNTDAGEKAEGNILANPNFEDGTNGWTPFVDETSEATFKKDGNAGLDIDIKDPGDRDWSVQLFQENLHLLEGKKYEVTIDLVSTGNRSIITAVQNYNAATESAKDYGSKTTKLKANERTTIQFTTDTIRTDVTAGKMYIGLGQVSGSDKACKLTIYSVNLVPQEGATAGANKTYTKLIWSDEFEGNKLNTDNWVYEKGNGDNGWGNGESQYYTDRSENLSVGDGMLKITARKEKYEDFQYTSARIKTQGKQSFKYGKIEARIKMDEGQGHWPAFWMLGDSISSEGWPKCGEIDIMEWSSNWEYSVGTAHWADANNNHAFNTGYTHTSSIGSIDTSQWHTYAVEWDETAIRFLCDGVRYHYVNIESDEFKEFHEKHFILLNVAVGGNFTNYTIDEKIFPRSMYVDYVRVYEPGEAEDTSGNDGGNGENNGGSGDEGGEGTGGENDGAGDGMGEDGGSGEGTGSGDDNGGSGETGSGNGNDDGTGSGNDNGGSDGAGNGTGSGSGANGGSDGTGSENGDNGSSDGTGSGNGDNGSGDGTGSGSGANGSSDGTGNGNGDNGSSDGTGNGSGANGGSDGAGTGNGANGSSDGTGSGSGANGSSDGAGTGSGSGDDGNSNGTGSGSGDDGSSDGAGSGSGNNGSSDGTGNGSVNDNGTGNGTGTGKDNANSTGISNGGISAGTGTTGGTNTNTSPELPANVAAGDTFESGSNQYKVTKAVNGAYTVELTASADKNRKTVEVPATVDYQGITFKVTTIGKKAFYKHKKLKKVTIGKNIKKIGAYAFAECKNLKVIKISSSKITAIGKKAFRSISPKAVIKTPKKKQNAYQKILKKARV